MPLNTKTQSTYYRVDPEYNMMITPDNGKHDAIGRTFLAYFCYKVFDKAQRLAIGVISCYNQFTRKGYRYPGYQEDTLSRDHWLYFVMTCVYSNYWLLKGIIKTMPWRISEKFNHTPDSWAWCKAIGGSKFWTWAFYTMEIPLIWVTIRWNNYIIRKAAFGEELSQEEWLDFISNEDINIDGMTFPRNGPPPRTDYEKKMSKKLYPTYSLHILAWQLYFMPDSKQNRKLCKLALQLCPKHNYVIKLLLGGHVTKAQVESYKGMTKYRWSTILVHGREDRGIKVLTEEEAEFNNIEVDLLWKLYNEGDK